jgi:glycosyltransferase involved in cell wall biosynthesis
MDQEIKRNKFRTEFGLDDETVAVGIIGRLVPVKNHSLFLKGLKYVLNNTSIKVKAFIIGDGESRGAIEQMANELGIRFSKHTDSEHPHPLVLTSWRTDVDTICAGLDIIALTSLNEGTPVSLIEAQAAGRPIVSTRVGGIADVVMENKTALLSDIADEKAFSKNLLQLVNDATLRHKFSNAGKDYVITQFSYQRLIKDMGNLYHDLLDRKKNGKE